MFSIKSCKTVWTSHFSYFFTLCDVTFRHPYHMCFVRKRHSLILLLCFMKHFNMLVNHKKPKCLSVLRNITHLCRKLLYRHTFWNVMIIHKWPPLLFYVNSLLVLHLNLLTSTNYSRLDKNMHWNYWRLHYFMKLQKYNFKVNTFKI